MPKPRVAVVCAVMVIVSVASSSSRAAGGLPPDPASNFTAARSCSAPTSCLTQAIDLLDRARAWMGQPAYRLPSNFSALSPAEQAFVLTDLDRVQYGLQPITGLTADLDASAATGVRLDRDPMPDTAGLTGVASNWAGGYGDMPLAYEAWMYADGPGGSNTTCITAASGGCWAHRHNVLRSFAGSGPLAMGSAAGVGADGAPGYALVLVQGSSAYHPAYLYTWSQALAAGAGTSTGSSQQRSVAQTARSPFRITLLRVRANSLRLHVQAPRGLRLSCALTRLSHAIRRDRYLRCGPITVYPRLGAGAYRLRVRAGSRSLTRFVRVR